MGTRDASIKTITRFLIFRIGGLCLFVRCVVSYVLVFVGSLKVKSISCRKIIDEAWILCFFPLKSTATPSKLPKLKLMGYDPPVLAQLGGNDTGTSPGLILTQHTTPLKKGEPPG